jgi:hypothetical protein
VLKAEIEGLFFSMNNYDTVSLARVFMKSSPIGTNVALEHAVPGPLNNLRLNTRVLTPEGDNNKKNAYRI